MAQSDKWDKNQSTTDESAFSSPKGLTREEAAEIVPKETVKTLTEKWESGVDPSRVNLSLIGKPSRLLKLRIM